MPGSYRERVRVVLVRPLRSGNVGSVARAMKNMGLNRLYLVAPQEDRHDLAHMMAPGAREIYDEAMRFDSLGEAVADCQWVLAATARGRKFRWPIHEPREAAEKILDTPGEIAVVFGPEDAGLDNEDLLLCQSIVTIVTDVATSLNLAQAVLVVAHNLFEEARSRGYEPPKKIRRSRRGTERLFPAGPQRVSPDDPGEEPASNAFVHKAASKAVELLEHTSYLNGRSKEQVQLTIHQLIQRTSPSTRDVSIILGMLAKTTYALENPDE